VVVGWVFGEAVTGEMLVSYLRDHPPPAAVGDGGKAASTWAARAVMTNMLTRQETNRRRLGHEDDLPAAVAAELVGEAGISAAEVEAYFGRNLHLFSQPERRRVRHVLCATQDEARSVADRAGAGERLDALARECSIDPGSRQAGGDLGLLKRGELAGEIEDLLFSADVGQIVGPVRSPFGWHVLVVDAIEEQRPPELTSVRDEIAAALAERRRREAYVAWLERRALDGITMAPGYDHPFQPSFLEWAHRH
jgi:parvulin-like peptidyl-prolyl isomerase